MNFQHQIVVGDIDKENKKGGDNDMYRYIKGEDVGR